jgi:hypothetical protein
MVERDDGDTVVDVEARADDFLPRLAADCFWIGSIHNPQA